MNRRFSRFEIAVLRAVLSRLPPAMAAALNQQLREVNLVQRSEREMRMYRVRLRFFNKPFSVQIAGTAPEFPLAAASCWIPELMAEVVATVWVVHGHIFSIELSRRVKNVAEGSVRSVRLMLELSSEAIGSIDSAAVQSWLSSAGLGAEVEQVKPPLTEEQRSLWLSTARGELPTDWLELVTACDGVVVPPWTVYGLVGMPHAVLGQRSYLVLAERQGLGYCLATSEGADARDVLAVSYEGEVLGSRGESLRAAIRRVESGSL